MNCGKYHGVCHGQLAAILLLSPALVWAAPGQKSSPEQLIDGAYLMQVFGSLLLVFGCIFGLIFLLKKFNGLPLAGSSPIRVVASAKVGSREKILLLEAGSQQLLVGVAAGSIRTLLVLEQPLDDPRASNKKRADFSSLLRASAGGGQPS